MQRLNTVSALYSLQRELHWDRAVCGLQDFLNEKCGIDGISGTLKIVSVRTYFCLDPVHAVSKKYSDFCYDYRNMKNV